VLACRTCNGAKRNKKLLAGKESPSELLESRSDLVLRAKDYIAGKMKQRRGSEKGDQLDV